MATTGIAATVGIVLSLVTNLGANMTLVESERVSRAVIDLPNIFMGLIPANPIEAFVHQGKEVRIIEKMPRLAASVFDSEMTEHLEATLKKHKVSVHLEETVMSFKGEDM